MHLGASRPEGATRCGTPYQVSQRRRPRAWFLSISYARAPSAGYRTTSSVCRGPASPCSISMRFNTTSHRRKKLTNAQPIWNFAEEENTLRFLDSPPSRTPSSLLIHCGMTAQSTFDRSPVFKITSVTTKVTHKDHPAQPRWSLCFGDYKLIYSRGF